MCLNCSCGKPNDDHGDKANITYDDLVEAGKANDQGLKETIANFMKTLNGALKYVSTKGEAPPKDYKIE